MRRLVGLSGCKNTRQVATRGTQTPSVSTWHNFPHQPMGHPSGAYSRSAPQGQRGGTCPDTPWGSVPGADWVSQGSGEPAMEDGLDTGLWAPICPVTGGLGPFQFQEWEAAPPSRRCSLWKFCLGSGLALPSSHHALGVTLRVTWSRPGSYSACVGVKGPGWSWTPAAPHDPSNDSFLPSRSRWSAGEVP